MKRTGRWALVVSGIVAVVAGISVGGEQGGARDHAGSDAARVALGRRLFHDGDLSINGTLSCATCHDPRHGFADGVTAHPGAHGEPGLRNVPSLVNVGAFSPLTWGNATLTTLEMQAMVPLTGEDPVEMAMKGQEAEMARRLSASPCYRRLFRASFPQTRGRIDFASVSEALAAFQRTIVSWDTAWDRAAAGGAPLSAAALRGETVFRGKGGCAACHSGPDFTDLKFHRLAGEPDAPANGDFGLARVTGRAEDRGLFRTPSLREVAVTAPYLHDGTAHTLAEAIARHGVTLPANDLADVAAFLGTLTDTTLSSDPRYVRPGKSCEV